MNYKESKLAADAQTPPSAAYTYTRKHTQIHHSQCCKRKTAADAQVEALGVRSVPEKHLDGALEAELGSDHERGVVELVRDLQVQARVDHALDGVLQTDLVARAGRRQQLFGSSALLVVSLTDDEEGDEYEEEKEVEADDDEYWDWFTWG